MNFNSQKIALCVASRGLIQSRTTEALLRNVQGIYRWWAPIFEHDKPIPEAQNILVRRSLLHQPEIDWLWFIEEDIEPPSFALSKLLLISSRIQSKILACRYLNEGGTEAWLIIKDRLAHAGMGCLLVHRSIFESLKEPWFDLHFDYHWEDGQLAKLPRTAERYGGQDVSFFAKLWEAGIEAHLTDIWCRHLKVIRYGEPNVNNGLHSIRAWEL